MRQHSALPACMHACMLPHLLHRSHQESMYCNPPTQGQASHGHTRYGLMAWQARLVSLAQRTKPCHRSSSPGSSGRRVRRRRVPRRCGRVLPVVGRRRRRRRWREVLLPGGHGPGGRCGGWSRLRLWLWLRRAGGHWGWCWRGVRQHACGHATVHDLAAQVTTQGIRCEYRIRLEQAP